MKKMSVFVLALLISMSMTAFSIDWSSVDPSDIDLSKVDLSGMDIYFQGPIEFYVEDVMYDGKAYAAILDYDGAGKMTIEIPDRVTTKMKPQAIDLADTDVSLRNGKVYLDNVIIENYSYSGYLSFAPPASFVAEVGTIAASPITPSARPSMASSVEELKNKISSLERTIKQKESEISRKDRKIDQKEGEIDDLNFELDRAKRRVEILESEIARVGERIPREGFSLTGPSSLTVGTVGMGNWSSSRTGARQMDSNQKFAKYVLRTGQDNNEYVYSFTGKGQREGWSGYGFHFLASGSKTAKGYGYGDSYLVWVTRDPANLQTDKTFVQLYRSYNDVRMVQLASQAIDGSIANNIDIEVYVNRSKGQIVVSVEDYVPLVYDEDTLVSTGNEVVLRTLGSAEFKNVRMETK